MTAAAARIRLGLLALLLALGACSPTSGDGPEAPPTVVVPETAGSGVSDARQAIRDAGLRVGATNDRSSDTIPIGSVIGTVPAAGTSLAPNSLVDIAVSTGSANVSVPVTAGRTAGEAETLIIDAGLAVGGIVDEASDTVPVGEVIRTVPRGGESVARGSSVRIDVSTGPANISVPAVTNLAEAAAVADIEAATLVVGTITGEADDMVPAGSVVSQDPVAGTMVSANTAVDLVISLGPADIATPQTVGLTEAAATTVLTGAGLAVGQVTRVPSVDFEAGSVVSQDPPAGTLVAATTAVDLVVSLGPDAVPVPFIVGVQEPQALDVLANAGLEPGVITREFSNTIPQGEVFRQGTPAGQLVAPDTALDFTVSLGPPIPTPNVTGLTRAEGEAALLAAELVVGDITEQSDANVPQGSIIGQDPAAGTNVPAGTPVDLVVSSGPPPAVVVPDVSGQTQAQAEAAIVGADLVVGTVTDQNDATIPAGSIISQTPAGGESVAQGSSVDLVRSLGPLTDTFSDEFSSDTLGAWQLRHVAEGGAPQYTVLDINQSTAGALTLEPTQTPGWFDDADGPFVFKELGGNFAVHTRVTADSVANPGQPPASNFNSAGLMARNAAGASGPENYVMLNVGRQDGRVAGGIGSETKTTIDSVSTLFIDAGSNAGSLILCRIGDVLHSFRWLTTDSDWVLLRSETRADLPSTLQVGMVVNAFDAPADLRAEFEFIRLLPAPTDVAGCTAGVAGG